MKIMNIEVSSNKNFQQSLYPKESVNRILTLFINKIYLPFVDGTLAISWIQYIRV